MSSNDLRESKSIVKTCLSSLRFKILSSESDYIISRLFDLLFIALCTTACFDWNCFWWTLRSWAVAFLLDLVGEIKSLLMLDKLIDDWIFEGVASVLILDLGFAEGSLPAWDFCRVGTGLEGVYFLLDATGGGDNKSDCFGLKTTCFWLDCLGIVLVDLLVWTVIAP